MHSPLRKVSLSMAINKKLARGLNRKEIPAMALRVLLGLNGPEQPHPTKHLPVGTGAHLSSVWDLQSWCELCCWGASLLFSYSSALPQIPLIWTWTLGMSCHCAPACQSLGLILTCGFTSWLDLGLASSATAHLITNPLTKLEWQEAASPNSDPWTCQCCFMF